MTLQEIYNQLKAEGHESDKGSIHSYIEVYEEILRPYRATAKNIFEIGLLEGASMRMWERYFSEQANVYGIDCDETPIGGRYDLRPIIAEGTHKIFIGDAEDQATIEKFFLGIKFDVIIEDANHSFDQQMLLYRNFKPYLNKDGIYIIEDIQEVVPFYKYIDSEKTIETIDRRHIKNRYDDVLVVIK